MDKQKLKHLIDTAAGREAADLCIKNCRVIDVFNQEVFSSDVYITDGVIAGFGGPSFPKARSEFDAAGKYLAPGLIDGHVHIESSHLSPAAFSRQVVPHGTTTVIADPHEICNVCGLEGFDYMLRASEDIALQVFLQFPSCVPCTPFENAGAVLNAPEIRSRIGESRVKGLGELMNFVGVCNADDQVLDKILAAKEAGKIIDGHSPGLGGYMLDAYSSVGILNDHECSTTEELKERIRRGFHVLIREGTVCRDLKNLLPAVTGANARFCLFCTDDRQAASLVKDGHIDNNVRLAVSEGLSPLTAIAMATINAAECFGLSDRGAVAPGRRADLILFESLEDFRPEEVWIGGRLAAAKGEYLAEDTPVAPVNVSGRMNVKDFSKERLSLPLTSEKVRTIRLIPYSVVTEAGNAVVSRDAQGCFIRDEQDIVKLAVIERHHGTGNIGLGLLEGFGLKGGALATSVAHDSHNIIAAGDNDGDMEIAVRRLIEMGGGMAIAKNGKLLDSFPHEIAGLMTNEPGEYVAERLGKLEQTARKELCIRDTADPFMTLCFMALPVIPALKITDMGLFDVNTFCHVPVEADHDLS
ncbi:MAG: adenine deaminase [Lachnospiraceae bacterium]|nr:adenine deaminase [Lachnospiraceae bacterium]